MRHVWLCGASEAVSYEDGNEWRKNCVKWFEDYSENFRAWNPNDYYNYNEQLHHNDGEIIRFCNHKVDQADVILVNLKDIRKSVGSISEIAWAYFMRKPIIGFLEDRESQDFYEDSSTERELKQLIRLIHPWIYEMCDRIEAGYNARLDALNYIEKYYGN